MALWYGLFRDEQAVGVFSVATVADAGDAVILGRWLNALAGAGVVQEGEWKLLPLKASPPPPPPVLPL